MSEPNRTIRLLNINFPFKPKGKGSKVQSSPFRVIMPLHPLFGLIPGFLLYAMCGGDLEG